MLNNKFTILFLIQFIFGYNIFYHTQDYKIASSSYVASYDTLKTIYNFANPACNQKNNRFEIIIYCGDYLFHPSIEGAISSGIKAGDQIN